MSFAYTSQQIRDRTKTVTRRIGWTFLKPGDTIQAVIRSRGLKKGERVHPLAVLRIVDVRQEPLRRILDDEYGAVECRLEGFRDGALSFPDRFVSWFAATHRCEVDDVVTRIEFAYV
jgi:hypothetical protein